MQNKIEVSHLSKTYKKATEPALKDISFSIADGEIIGLLGPNGAGKSTLVKLILGVMEPDGGDIEVLGKNPRKFNRLDKMKLGVYLGGKSNLIYHLPVIDSVNLFATMYEVPKTELKENLTEYARLLDCEKFLNQRVATLSLGQRLRAELLCILIYKPQLLVLDEPTIGLDIEGKRSIRMILRELVKIQKTSVLITTHDVNDMEKLCDKIMVISSGKKIMDYTKFEFEKILMESTIVVSDCEIEENQQTFITVGRENEQIRYLVKNSKMDLFLAQIHENTKTRFLTQEKPKLEDLLYEYYR